MKLLFINRVYPPAEGATGFLLQELAEALASKGHEITIVTSALSSAVGAPQKKSLEQKQSGRVKVLRVRGLPFTRASHWKRALAYLSLYPALFFKALRSGPQDAIITLTDPPLQLVLGPMLQLWKRCKLVHWAQDIYPELAEELGVLTKKGLAGKMLRFFSTTALKRYDLIIAVGRCMRQRLAERGLNASKIVVVPNWAQESSNSAALMSEQINQFKTEHGFAGKFVVMYSGNFGLAHDFSAIVKAVEILAAQAPDIQFVFVGGGPRFQWLKDQTERFPNTLFLPFQPKELLGVSLGAADVHMASMKEELNGLVVPSKVYGILAAAKPCVFLGPKNSEAGLFIAENQCGTQVAPEDSTELCQVLLKYKSGAELREVQGKNASLAMGKVQFGCVLGHWMKQLKRLQA